MTGQELVQILAALLTPALAVMTAYIAWQQHLVSRNTLRYALYDRRLKVFQAFMSYLSDIAREGKVTDSRVLQFATESSEAEFLFDDAVVSKAEELYSKGLDLAELCKQINPSDGSTGLPVGNERSQVTRKMKDLSQYFREQKSGMKAIFRAQMGIQEIGGISLPKSVPFRKKQRNFDR